MTDLDSDQRPKIDAREPHVKEPAQIWGEKVWSETILRHKDVQTPQAKLQKRVDEFLAHASVQERLELEQSRQQLQAFIQEAKAARKSKGDGGRDTSFKAKVKDAWNSASEAAYRYSQILDPMLAYAPAYVSLAYGGIKIILIAQINYQELKEKVQLHLEQIASRFDIIDHLTAYIPTKDLVDKVASAYSLFTKFLSKAVKYYTQSRIKTYWKALTNPWARFQELVDAISGTFVDIKDIAELHGLVAGRVALEVGQQTLALVKEQQQKTDNQDANLARILSELHTISIQFNKLEDVNETAAHVRQRVSERRDDPALRQKPAEEGAGTPSVLDKLGGLFADLKSYHEETQRRKVIIEETPDMRSHRSTQRNLLRSEKVLTWIESETSRLLWVEGNQVLRRSEFNAYFAIPLLVMGESSYESTLVLRHFCGGTEMAKKPSTLLQALLYQIIERHPGILEAKKDAFSQQKASTCQGLWKLFVECLQVVNAQCTFIIIDSFDKLETANPETEVKDTLLLQLESLINDKSMFVKILLTASLARPLAALPDEYQALTRFGSAQQPGGLRRSLSMAAAEEQAQLISHQIIEIQERRCKAVSFQELPFLYPSGTLIYQKDGNHWRAFIVAELSGMDRQPLGNLGPLQIRVWFVDHDGIYFSKKYHTLTVTQFSGKKSITSLKYIPAGYLPDETAVRKSLADRGCRYWELGSNVCYKQFEGKHGPARIVIDQQMRPMEDTKQDHTDKFQKYSAVHIKPQVLMTCPPDIAVYLLSELRWSEIKVIEVQDLVIDKYRSTNQILIRREYKYILLSLVPGKDITERNQDSETRMQGTTVLLHGPPGSGKTFTVECLAESAERPLLRLTHDKLGGTAHEMAQNLGDYFRLSDRWGCIMLLDDVDVFLTQRVASDLTQNMMGSLFMQITETYNGVLFLTTNRVGSFDFAFSSRISLKFYFPELTLQQAKHVLYTSLDRIKDRLTKSGVRCIMDIEKYEIVEWMESLFSLKSIKVRTRINGREIVNMCEMALILAQQEAKEKRRIYDTEEEFFKGVELVLREDHFISSIRLSSEFQAYMTGLQQPNWNSGPWEDHPVRSDQPLRARFAPGQLASRGGQMPDQNVDYSASGYDLPSSKQEES